MVVVVGVNDLFFQSKIIEVASTVHGDIVLAKTEDAVLETTRELEPKHVILDLNDKEIDAVKVSRRLREENETVHIVGFVSHVERDLIARAKAAGCHDVFPRSLFVKKLPELLG
jgi:DNA-binding NarL/FixJ family response regulator